jgi:hypothetical protein
MTGCGHYFYIVRILTRNQGRRLVSWILEACKNIMFEGKQLNRILIFVYYRKFYTGIHPNGIIV